MRTSFFKISFASRSICLFHPFFAPFFDPNKSGVYRRNSIRLKRGPILSGFFVFFTTFLTSFSEGFTIEFEYNDSYGEIEGFFALFRHFYHFFDPNKSGVYNRIYMCKKNWHMARIFTH